MNVANNRMLRRFYEICSLHLNKFYPLPPQISVFWKFMDSIAGFEINFFILEPAGD